MLLGVPLASGIALGALLNHSGLVRAGRVADPLSVSPPFGGLLALCLACATLSAVMINTATAGFMLPLAVLRAMGTP